MVGRWRVDNKKTETRGGKSHTCSDDLFNFHKRHINLLGKLPDSFIRVLISERVNVDLHPWGALLDKISRLTSQRGYCPCYHRCPQHQGYSWEGPFSLPGGCPISLPPDHSSSLPSVSLPYFPLFSALDAMRNRLLISDRSGPVPTPGTQQKAKKLIDANQMH